MSGHDPRAAAFVPTTATRSIHVPADQVDGECWPVHHHAEHELLWAVRGRLVVTTPQRHYVVPPGTSTWIPAGVPHEVRAAAGCTLRCTWLRAHDGLQERSSVCVLVTPSLFERVMEHLMSSPLTDQERYRAEAFALDLLEPARDVRLDVPRPRTPWLVAVTDLLAVDPSHRRTLQQWAAHAAVSPRTFARTFEKETGQSFASWRHDLRMRTAMQRLVTGEPAGAVARAVGFVTQAAFTTSFRRATGTTPAAFARTATAAATGDSRTARGDHFEQEHVSTGEHLAPATRRFRRSSVEDEVTLT